MQKTLIVTFGVDPKVDETQRLNVLEEALSNLKRRRFDCEQRGDNLVIRRVCKDWDTLEGSHDFPENTLWGLFVEGMTFLDFVVEYEDALLPSPEAGYNGNFQFRNGECYFNIEIRDQVVVTCLPGLRKVSISLKEIPDCHNDEDTLRKGFIDIMLRLEAQLRLTQTSLRLILSYEVDRENIGRRERFKNRLFLEIAKI